MCGPLESMIIWHFNRLIFLLVIFFFNQPMFVTVSTCLNQMIHLKKCIGGTLEGTLCVASKRIIFLSALRQDQVALSVGMALYFLLKC